MAKFSVNGMDSLERSFAELATLSDQERGRILQAGAEVIKESQIDYLNRHHRRTGELAKSIKIKLYSDEAVIEPIGKYTKTKKGRKIRQRHSGSGGTHRSKHHGGTKASTMPEVAYYLAFGTPRMAATHWDENANEESADRTTQAMADEWNNLITEKGL